MKTWYQELGFFTNPFSIKPAMFTNDVFGYKKIADQISDDVTNGKMVLLVGNYGTGKSTILKHLIEEFGGNKRVVYFNANQKDGTIDFRKVLLGASSWLSRLFGMLRSDLILFIDEAQDLDSEDIANIKQAFESGDVTAIVFVAKKDDISAAIAKMVHKTYATGTMNEKNAIALVRSRVGKISFLSDDIVTKVFKKNKNPRLFLKALETACRNAYEKGAKKVTEKHLKS